MGLGEGDLDLRIFRLYDIFHLHPYHPPLYSPEREGEIVRVRGNKLALIEAIRYLRAAGPALIYFVRPVA